MSLSSLLRRFLLERSRLLLLDLLFPCRLFVPLPPECLYDSLGGLRRLLSLSTCSTRLRFDLCSSSSSSHLRLSRLRSCASSLLKRSSFRLSSFSRACASSASFANRAWLWVSVSRRILRRNRVLALGACPVDLLQISMGSACSEEAELTSWANMRPVLEIQSFLMRSLHRPGGA